MKKESILGLHVRHMLMGAPSLVLQSQKATLHAFVFSQIDFMGAFQLKLSENTLSNIDYLYMVSTKKWHILCFSIIKHRKPINNLPSDNFKPDNNRANLPVFMQNWLLTRGVNYNSSTQINRVNCVLTEIGNMHPLKSERVQNSDIYKLVISSRRHGRKSFSYVIVCNLHVYSLTWSMKNNYLIE